MRQNVKNVIRPLIECYNGKFCAPTEALRNMLMQDDNLVGKNKNLCGIYLCSSFAANRVPLFSNESAAADLFYRALISLMGSTHKLVFKSVAELLGLLIGTEIKNNSVLLSKLVTDEIERISKCKDEADVERFILVLNRISAALHMDHLHLIAEFSPRIMYLFPNLFGSIKTACLETIAAVSHLLENIFIELKSNLKALLAHNDHECQKYTVMILISITSSLNEEQVVFFLDVLISNSLSNPNVSYRMAFYTLMARLVVEAVQKRWIIQDKLKNAFLKGLADNDSGIREKINDFYDLQLRNDSNIIKRFSMILTSMYTPDIEDSYLMYGSSFLLQDCIRSNLFDTKVFLSSSDDEGIEEMDIDTSWSRTGSLQPEFTVPKSIFNQRELFATHDMNWTPTMDITNGSLRKIFSSSQASYAHEQAETRPQLEFKTRKIAGDIAFFSTQAARKSKLAQRLKLNSFFVKAKRVKITRKFFVSN